MYRKISFLFLALITLVTLPLTAKASALSQELPNPLTAHASMSEGLEFDGIHFAIQRADFWDGHIIFVAVTQSQGNSTCFSRTDFRLQVGDQTYEMISRQHWIEDAYGVNSPGTGFFTECVSRNESRLMVLPFALSAIDGGAISLWYDEQSYDMSLSYSALESASVAAAPTPTSQPTQTTLPTATPVRLEVVPAFDTLLTQYQSLPRREFTPILDSLVGAEVKRWSGRVYSNNSLGLGMIGIDLPSQVVGEDQPQDLLLRVTSQLLDEAPEGSQVTFSGKVVSYNRTFGNLSLVLGDVVLDDVVRPSPTATPLPTNTPLPTATPLPATAQPVVEKVQEPTATPALVVEPAASPATEALSANPLGQPAQVVHIVDGDTIDVLIDGIEYRVRYILMDTPERGMPYYAEATTANAALVEGQTVFLVKDVSETDRYGRLLRYIYLADGTFVNEALVRQGFAQIATFPPDVAMEAQIRAAQEEARTAGRGLWAAPVAAESAPAANQNGNLRGGPGTEYEIVGSVTAGQPLQVVYKNPAGDWYQLDTGVWIAAFLVNGVAADVPVASSLPAAPVVVEQPVVQEQPAVEERSSTVDVSSGSCDPSYPDVCIPPIAVRGDLDCGDVPQFARFRVLSPDPHGFDREGDGLGCESN